MPYRFSSWVRRISSQWCLCDAKKTESHEEEDNRNLSFLLGLWSELVFEKVLVVVVDNKSKHRQQYLIPK